MRKEDEVEVGYYGGRGFHDAKPKRWVKEFRLWVPRSISRDDDALWRACEKHLRKKYPSKNPLPSVDEVWLW
jgi:hypothetical protein